MKRISFLVVLFSFLSLVAFGARKYKLVVIETSMGPIKVRLFQDTPLHSENFLRLVDGHHYDSLLFHRVIKDFMIQGGASDSRRAPQGKMLGMTDPGYTIEAEIRPEHFHVKGALAAAREGDDTNPERKSSAEQFYIVQGRTYTDAELDRMEQQRLMEAKNKLGKQLFAPKQAEYRLYLSSGDKAKADSLISTIDQEIEKEFKDYKQHMIQADARDFYKSIGGAPFLDGEYTVFGEVVEGMDIIDKIAAVRTDQNDRPVEDVMMIRTLLKRK